MVLHTMEECIHTHTHESCFQRLFKDVIMHRRYYEAKAGYSQCVYDGPSYVGFM